MTSLGKEILAIIAMLCLTSVLVICIANEINHGIIYTGLTAISGIGGYTIGRIVTKK